MRKDISLFLVMLLFSLSLQSTAKTVRLLSIGNSFSEDAVEQNLYELCLEEGDTMIIGNAYQSGYSLKNHWNDVESKVRHIEYCKVLKGVRYIFKHCALDSLITDEPWDIITLQQVSQDAGDKVSFEPYLTNLLNYLQVKSINPHVRFGFHQTWAYAQNVKHPGFAKYKKDQMTMYKAVVKTIKKMMAKHPEISFIVPSGTAIQNVRNTSVGDHVNRDGFHLNHTIGRYTVACVWAEIITGKSCVGKKYYPKAMTAELATLGQKAAHAAVKRPNRVSKIK